MEPVEEYNIKRTFKYKYKCPIHHIDQPVLLKQAFNIQRNGFEDVVISITIKYGLQCDSICKYLPHLDYLPIITIVPTTLNYGNYVIRSYLIKCVRKQRRRRRSEVVAVSGARQCEAFVVKLAQFAQPQTARALPYLHVHDLAQVN